MNQISSGLTDTWGYWQMQMETHTVADTTSEIQEMGWKLIKSDMDRSEIPFNFFDLQIVRKLDWRDKNWK